MPSISGSIISNKINVGGLCLTLIDKFTRMDTNGDGVISTEELNQMPTRHRGGKRHRR
jgi:Ca2+-binding EF-hand superfamily protein